jgi:hypothetical protein
MVAREQFEWLRGDGLVRQYELPDAKYYCTAFCTVCGSSLPWLTRNGKLYLVPAGTLDDDPGATVERSIYWGSRASWYRPTDELPSFDEKPV